MPTRIKAVLGGVVGLPVPFMGVVASARDVFVDLPRADVVELLGGERAVQGILEITTIAGPVPNTNYGREIPFGGPISVNGEISSTETISGDKGEFNDIEVATSITTTGDLNAVGGFQHVPGCWVRAAVAASLVDDPLGLFVTGGPTQFPAVKDGSIIGISAHLSIPPAGSNLIIKVFVAGVDTGAQLLLIDGGLQTAAATFAKDTFTFDQLDLIDIRINTGAGWTALAGILSVFLLIEE